MLKMIQSLVQSHRPQTRQIDGRSITLKKKTRKKKKEKKKGKNIKKLTRQKYRQKIITRYTKGVRGFFSEKFSLED